MLLNIIDQSRNPFGIFSARHWADDLHRTAGEVLDPCSADRVEAFHGQAEAVEMDVAHRATFIRHMRSEHLANRFDAFLLRLRQLRHVGRWRREVLAEYMMHDPEATLHR